MSDKIPPSTPTTRFFSFIWNPPGYLGKSTIHGFNQLSNKNASTNTRLFFVFIGCCSFLLCSYLIVLQIQEYQNQVLITKMTSTTYPVWNFRFPSVTVCNSNIVYKDNMKKLKHVATSHGINEEVFLDFIKNLSFLIAYDDAVYNHSDFSDVYEVLRRSGYNVDRIMSELAQPCSGMVKRCFWKAEEVPCSQIIQTVKTRHGYCCSFNYYGTRNIAQRIEDPHNLRYTYTGLVGETYGLKLLLDPERDQYVTSLSAATGLNVLVQDGADYLNLNLMITNSLRPDEELKIAVSPSVYVTSENVRNLKIEQRRCLYEDEGQLEWSSIYSYRTCMNQCRARAIFDLCGCMPFYFPFENFTRICTLSDVHCLQANSFKYAALDVPREMMLDDDEDENQKRRKGYVYCQCYPQCDERIFDIRAFKFKQRTVINAPNSDYSLLKVYYTVDDSIKIEKDVSYTWDRIFGEIGGIFSLCLGASVISILECFYFFGKSATSCKATVETETPETHVNTYIIYDNYDKTMKKSHLNANAYEKWHTQIQRAQKEKY